MCAIDWGLVLEWFKALWPPVALMAGVGVGVRTYRWQRRFDRRIEWYIGTHATIQSVHLQFARAAALQERRGLTDPVAVTALASAIETGKPMSEFLSKAFLFGIQADHDALIVFIREMGRAHEELQATGTGITRNRFEKIDAACQSAMVVIARGCRRELGLGEIDLSKALEPQPPRTRGQSTIAGG